MQEMLWRIQTTFVFQYHTRGEYYSLDLMGAPYLFVIHARIARGRIPALQLGLN